MTSLFFDLLYKDGGMLAIIAIAAYLSCALAILLFHLAFHKPSTDGKKFVAIVAVLAGLLLLASVVPLVMGIPGLAYAAAAGWWIRPGRGGRIVLAAAIPVAVIGGIWVYGALGEASLKYERRKYFLAEEARKAAETAEFVKREHFVSSVRDDSLAFDDAARIDMGGTGFSLPIPRGFRYQTGVYLSYGDTKWVARFDNPANGDFFVVVFNEPVPSDRRDAVTETIRAAFYEKFLWLPKSEATSMPGVDRILEQNSPLAAIAYYRPTDNYLKSGTKNPRDMFGACVAVRKREFLLAIHYAPLAVDFGPSLPVTWLNRFVESNRADAAPLPPAPEKSADPAVAKHWPTGMPPKDKSAVDPTKPEWFFAEQPTGPEPVFKTVEVEELLFGPVVVPVPEGWENVETLSPDTGYAEIYQSNGTTGFNLHMFAIAKVSSEDPSLFMDEFRRRGLSREGREFGLSDFGNVLKNADYELERLAPGRMVQNLPDAAILMEPVRFRKGKGETGKWSVGSLFCIGFMLGGQPVYARCGIGSDDGTDRSYLFQAWVNKFVELNRHSETGTIPPVSPVLSETDTPAKSRFSTVLLKKDDIHLWIPVPDKYTLDAGSQGEANARTRLSFANAEESKDRFNVTFNSIARRETGDSLLAQYKKRYVDVAAVTVDVKAGIAAWMSPSFNDFAFTSSPKIERISSEVVVGSVEARVAMLKNSRRLMAFLAGAIATKEYQIPFVITVNPDNQKPDTRLALAWLDAFATANGADSRSPSEKELAEAIVVNGAKAAAEEARLFEPASFFVSSHNDPALPYAGERKAIFSAGSCLVPVPAGFSVEFENQEGLISNMNLDDSKGNIFILVMLDAASAMSLVADKSDEMDMKEIFETGKKQYSRGGEVAGMIQRVADGYRKKGVEIHIEEKASLVQNTEDSIFVACPAVMKIPQHSAIERQMWIFIGTVRLEKTVLTIIGQAISESEDTANRVFMSWLNRLLEVNGR